MALDKVLDVMENEQFVDELSQLTNSEQIKGKFASKGIDLEKELATSEELDQEALMSVAGGVTKQDLSNISKETVEALLKSVKFTWNAAISYGIIMTAFVDAKRGDVTRHYSVEKIEQAYRNLGLGWLL